MSVPSNVARSVEFTAVVTTGIYCVPRCSARPKPENTRRYPSAAAAEAAGFRACRRCRPEVWPDGVAKTLRYRTPFDGAGLFAFLAARAIPGVLNGSPGSVPARRVAIDGGPLVVEVGLEPKSLVLHLWEAVRPKNWPRSWQWRGGCSTSTPTLRRSQLCSAPIRSSARSCALRPRPRLPGAVDGFELAVRAIVGQQVTVAAAAHRGPHRGARCGTPVGELVAFPRAVDVADADLADIGMPAARVRTIRGRGAARRRRQARARRHCRRRRDMRGAGGGARHRAVDGQLRAPARVARRRRVPAGDLGVRRALERLGHPGDATICGATRRVMAPLPRATRRCTSGGAWVRRLRAARPAVGAGRASEGRGIMRGPRVSSARPS